jgi:hypothetical protein
MTPFVASSKSMQPTDQTSSAVEGARRCSGARYASSEVGMYVWGSSIEGEERGAGVRPQSQIFHEKSGTPKLVPTFFANTVIRPCLINEEIPFVGLRFRCDHPNS